MSGQTLSSESQARPAEFCWSYVQFHAERFGIFRRMHALDREFWDRIERSGEYPSSEEERIEDWLDACAFLSLKIMEGKEFTLGQLEPAAYRLLEDAWLKTIKQLKAYYIWRANPSGNSEDDYFQASQDIRAWLRERPRVSLEHFEPVKKYLQECYLLDADTGRLDVLKPGTDHLISRKAQRIWDTTRLTDDEANWFRAKTYVSMFYANIVAAVVRDDYEGTRMVLKALEFSKSPTNRYLIINGFETAIVIDFLNKDVVRDILETPRLYTFSMEPVDDWPYGDRISGLRYDRDAKQLIYEGVMSDAEKQELLIPIREQRFRLAVERLYQQSQLGPFKDMIL